jgi:hypothetical protein
LFSQALYYHPVEKWNELIDYLAGFLSPGGELLIILNKDEGDWWKAVEPFWKKHPEKLRFHYIPSRSFILDLSSRYELTTSSFSYQHRVKNKNQVLKYLERACLPLRKESDDKSSRKILRADLRNSNLLKQGTHNYVSELILIQRKKVLSEQC